METAEDVTSETEYDKLAVIAGIGAREYYREKLGYHQDGPYSRSDSESRERYSTPECPVSDGHILGASTPWADDVPVPRQHARRAADDRSN